MAASGIELRDLDTTNPYDDVDDVRDILNASKYESVSFEQIEKRLKALKEIKDVQGIEDLNTAVKGKITTENLDKLKTLIQRNYPTIDDNIIELEKIELRKRILSKNGDLYLRTIGAGVKEVVFGKHKYKAIKITSNQTTTLNKLATLQTNGLSTTDAYYKLLNGVHQSTKLDVQIERAETLIKQVAVAHDDMTISPLNRHAVMQEPIRPLLESTELNDILSDEDRQKIVKYLDFIKLNYGTKIKLLSDIEYYKKEHDKAERQLSSETNDDQRVILEKFKSDCKANMQTSKQMLDQILAYNERQYEDINIRLKSKFTFKQKLLYIFRKYGLTITAISLALGLIIDTIIPSTGGAPTPPGSPPGDSNKIKQSLKNFSNWLLEMSKKALENLPAIIGNIIAFLLKTTASLIGFLAEHLILFVIAAAFALYEAIQIGYNDINKRKK